MCAAEGSPRALGHDVWEPGCVCYAAYLLAVTRKTQGLRLARSLKLLVGCPSRFPACGRAARNLGFTLKSWKVDLESLVLCCQCRNKGCVLFPWCKLVVCEEDVLRVFWFCFNVAIGTLFYVSVVSGFLFLFVCLRDRASR